MLELDELIDGLLAAIQRNVPSDYVSLNDIGPDPDRVISVVTPPAPGAALPGLRRIRLPEPADAPLHARRSTAAPTASPT